MLVLVVALYDGAEGRGHLPSGVPGSGWGWLPDGFGGRFEADSRGEHFIFNRLLQINQTIKKISMCKQLLKSCNATCPQPGRWSSFRKGI